MSLAPVLLFTYNRPAHTRQTLEALLNNKLCKDSELFVFSDGYKNDSDKVNVLRVREIIHSVDGFKAVHIEENIQNRGLARNIIRGVSRIVNEYGKVIVLEDDLVTSPYFLTFINEVLEQFEDDEKIGHVHGFCYPGLDLPDAFLIKWAGSWGWGTWKRAWDLFNPDGTELLFELHRRKLTRAFDFNGGYPYTRMLRRQIGGMNDSWAIRWYASLFLKDMLSVNAGKSLVQNIGFDGSGTHSGSQEIYTTTVCKRKIDIRVSAVEENKAARRALERYYRKTSGFWAKARRRINRILRTKQG